MLRRSSRSRTSLSCAAQIGPEAKHLRERAKTVHRLDPAASPRGKMPSRDRCAGGRQHMPWRRTAQHRCRFGGSDCEATARMASRSAHDGRSGRPPKVPCEPVAAVLRPPLFREAYASLPTGGVAQAGVEPQSGSSLTLQRGHLTPSPAPRRRVERASCAGRPAK